MGLSTQPEDDFLAASITDRGESWVRWFPQRARERPDLLRAVHEFSSLDTEAGEEATRWLKEDALLNHGSTVTRLMLLDGRVQGYYALASTQVRLYTRDHKKLLQVLMRRNNSTPARETGGGVGAGAFTLKPVQPASLVAWIARCDRSDISGVDLLWHAAKTALKIAEEQGNIALVLDPWDDATAEKIWLKPPYNFKRSAPLKGAESGDPARRDPPRRLWRTLMSSEEGPV